MAVFLFKKHIAAENKALRGYCDKEGLTYRQDRTQIYGYSDTPRKKKAVDFVETVDKSGESGIIKLKNNNISISSIEAPIEQHHTGKGNPNAVLTFGVELNDRQQKLLDALPDYDSHKIVSKNSVNMADLSALTAKTGDEFAMFTKGSKRLVVRGNYEQVNINIKDAVKLAKESYRWNGHTHPGINENSMIASPGDYAVLDCFEQSTSVIYNSKGQFRTFEKEE